MPESGVTTGQLKQWFDAVDRDRSGQISAKELQTALDMGQLKFSLATVAHMIRMHDKDGSGSINFQEFEHLTTFLTEMRSSFNYFDSDRGGSLSLDEIHRAITHAGFQLDQPAFTALVGAFDPDRNALLGVQEFIAMTLFLKSCSAIFTAFDPQRSGKVTLDFNQFVYAASNSR
ncbi:unnamed protein product [Ostreobium quekettii]|uniref:EF-hand domain-containing protein n=1 Tax=Ostreobium quekettii TaxID=121088 RepID=A0A8S1J651_9CHLO|nr:unnamed protein product [Ostreobium quekettii]|eukprot:evm.model.scf_2176EXC.1 EVM.evm.TU.scf_2176EXC.1   scf_2176EXC:15390-17495(+)